jgi:hypothetical protein
VAFKQITRFCANFTINFPIRGRFGREHVGLFEQKILQSVLKELKSQASLNTIIFSLGYNADVILLTWVGCLMENYLV